MTSLLNIAGNVPTDAFAEGSSLRFEDGDSAYLSFTPASAGNRKTWTWSGWVKRGNLGGSMRLFYTRDSSGQNQGGLYFNNDGIKYFARTSNTTRGEVYTPALFRDVSAWYHVVGVLDAANNSFKIYVNGVEQSLTTGASISNVDHAINQTEAHHIGREPTASSYYDGYLANVAFIDGQALTPTSFGEYEDTLWKPKPDTDIQALTFGTNGFYLPFDQTTEAEGFSTVTWTGNGGTQGIEGVGFEPDFVWIKNRSSALDHRLFDSVRGANETLFSNTTSAEYTDTDQLMSFDSKGFTVGADTGVNQSSSNHVAWCWDAGTGSAASNTDGSITSSVKANTTNGFSIVSYTGNATSGATVGHGLGVAPDMVIVKNRSAGSTSWPVYHNTMGTGDFLYLNSTQQQFTDTGVFNTAPTSSSIVLGSYSVTNGSGNDMIAYCFHSVSGYSDIGSFSGDGTTDGSNVVTTGFKPAFIMIKRSDSTGDWAMFDNTRSPSDPTDVDDVLFANYSLAEQVNNSNWTIEFTANGFAPKNSTYNNASGGTYIYMAFADTRDATFFGDTSGNSNNWTPNALNNTDVVPDSPVTNFATLSPLDAAGISSSFYLSEGNLAYSVTNNSSYRNVSSTFFPEGLKGYYEFSVTTGTPNFYIGMYPATSNPSASLYTATNTIQLLNNGTLYNGSTTLISSMLSSFSAGDVGMIAFDFTGSSKYIWFGKNGSWGVDGSSNTQDPAGGNNPAHTFTTEQQLYFASNTGSGTQTIVVNFGQDSSFAGNETPQGNTDDNGQGDFFYAPPSGFLALNRNNLPLPDILDPADYFNTVLYTGDGSTSGNIINTVGFDPSFVWIKRRSAVDHHMLYDLVRHSSNPKQALSSSLNYAESSITGDDLDFVTGGFEPKSSNAIINGSGSTYAAWNWLAGGTAVSNTDGSITSFVSANTDAGFSVIGYTGTGANATIGHNLNQEPKIAFFKNRDTTNAWRVYYNVDGFGAGVRYLTLNSTDASVYDTSIWQGTSASSTTINIGSAAEVNGSGGRIICYAFHSVESYSKCGVYTGNGSADGTFVHCGFRPAFVMIKRTDGITDWMIKDNQRPEYNPAAKSLRPNQSAAEFDNSNHYIDLLSNGFKCKGTDNMINASSGTYIFLAFAEAPFKNANAR